MADQLFTIGLADPRGCEYREIDVVVGSVWGSAGIATTNGWVLPADAKLNDRYAICWNGLVYPATRIGDVRDPADDVRGVLATTAAWRAKLPADRRDVGRDYTLHALDEGTAVAKDSLTLTKLPLLIRISQTSLAEQYSAFLYAPEADAKPLSWAIASEWTWCHFDRAVCAHMRGDDAIAVSSTRILSAAAPAIEKYAADHGIKNPYVDRDRKDVPYLTALGPLPVLAADCERRIVRKPLASLEDVQLIKVQPARIEGLIQQLEMIKERQWGQPGGVSIAESPIIRALEKEGDAAIEPLLACMEKDRRLTQSVSFHRDFFTHRNLITVADAAEVAVKQILQFSEFGYAEQAERLKRIWALWETTRGNTPAQRWFAILADDKATLRQWVEAAGRIVQPIDVESRGGWVNVPQRKPGEVPAMRGESLRQLKNPSVSELMIRRIPQIAAADGGHQFSIDNANTVARCLTKWDPSSATITIREQLERTKASLRDLRNRSNIDMLKIDVGRLSIALAKGGDKTAIKDYTVWLREQRPDAAPSDTEKLFEPLWQFPDDPDVIATMKAMFLDRDSPWRNLSLAKTSFGGQERLFLSPLVSMAAFRENLIANFSDTTRVGTATKKDQSLSFKSDAGTSGGYGLAEFQKDDPLSPAPGEERIIRVCDWYAWKLSRLTGTPAFELYWPEAERDKAIKSYEAFLRHWGPAFAWNNVQAIVYDPSFSPASITIPQRDRPASKQEVEAGAAIFALEGQARVLRLSRFPAEATWQNQRGRVWQAEEVQENGHWQPYFGFIGPHSIAKVPAAEVKLESARIEP